MSEVNVLGSVVGGVLSFAIGGLWYSPLVFGGAWMKGVGVTEEQLAWEGKPGLIYGVGMLISILGAMLLSVFLGPDPSADLALGVGASAGLFWVGGSFAISYLFERRPLYLWAINAGYHTIQFTIIGYALAIV